MFIWSFTGCPSCNTSGYCIVTCSLHLLVCVLNTAADQCETMRALVAKAACHGAFQHCKCPFLSMRAPYTNQYDNWVGASFWLYLHSPVCWTAAGLVILRHAWSTSSHCQTSARSFYSARYSGSNFATAVDTTVSITDPSKFLGHFHSRFNWPVQCVMFIIYPLVDVLNLISSADRVRTAYYRSWEVSLDCWHSWYIVASLWLFIHRARLED